MLIFLLAIAAAPSPDFSAPQAQLDFIDALDRGWRYSAVLEDSESGESFVVTVTNPGSGTYLLFDAGTAFAGPDDIQPAVVTEDLLVFIPAGATKQVALTHACGSAYADSGMPGTRYEEGVGAISKELAHILDRFHEELSEPDIAVQDLVWVYTDAHDVASIYVKEADQAALMRILDEEVKDFEAPGYAIQYKEPESEEGARFTGEAMEARCEVHVNLPSAMSCKVVLLQPDGGRLDMMSGVEMSTGRHEFFLTIGLEGYPPGDYTLQLEGERFGQTLFSRDIRLQGRG